MGWNKNKTKYTLDGPGSGAGLNDIIYKTPEQKALEKKLRKARQRPKEGTE